MNYYEMLTDAKAIDDHRVFVTFEGGQTGVFDCSGYFGKPYWRKLSDPAFFKSAYVSYGTLTWPEDIDIEPEEVWKDAVRTNRKEPLQVQLNKEAISLTKPFNETRRIK